MSQITKHYFFDLPLSCFKRDELVTFINQCYAKKNKGILYGFSFDSVYRLKTKPEIIDYGRRADVLVVDGRPFYWLVKRFGTPVIDNISIPKSVLLALDIANQNNKKVMLLGATEEINKLAIEKVKLKYLNLSVSGFHGYFDFENELDKVIEEINKVKPDLLLIGISSPKKEIIAVKYKNIIHAGLIIPCGGMIDVLAGVTKLTPEFIKKIGLASVYRIIQEPRRLLRDRVKLYLFVFFNLLPTLFLKKYLQRNKKFSLINYYKN